MTVGADQPSAGSGLDEDPALALSRQVLPDRFEVLTQPLGWRCRSCGASVSTDGPDRPDRSELVRLAETAADHALYCGRCDD